MKPVIGKTYLITTDNWFIAPDGEEYRSVFGTVNEVLTDEESLGIKTNRGSTNWYVSIGNMLVAGCQIHYCIQTDSISCKGPEREIEHNGELSVARSRTRIYKSDK